MPDRPPIPDSEPDEPSGGLALVGYRGTGKSTVGRVLAERLGRPFLDADRELERRLGRSIRDIFAQDGEPAFREHEEAILRDLTTTQPNLILATGGGAVLREANRRALRQLGVVVWLRADPEIIAQRLCRDDEASRPALTPAGTLAEIADVLAARTPWYQAVSDLVVDTDGLTPDEVAESVLGVWWDKVVGDRAGSTTR